MILESITSQKESLGRNVFTYLFGPWVISSSNRFSPLRMKKEDLNWKSLLSSGSVKSPFSRSVWRAKLFKLKAWVWLRKVDRTQLKGSGIWGISWRLWRLSLKLLFSVRHRLGALIITGSVLLLNPLETKRRAFLLRAKATLPGSLKVVDRFFAA